MGPLARKAHPTACPGSQGCPWLPGFPTRPPSHQPASADNSEGDGVLSLTGPRVPVTLAACAICLSAQRNQLFPRGHPSPAPHPSCRESCGGPPRGFWGKHLPPTHFNSPVPPVPGYSPAPALVSSFPPLLSAPPTKYDEVPLEGVSCRPCQQLAVKQPAMGPSRICSGLQGLIRCPRLEPEQARPQGPTSKAWHQANPHTHPSPFPLHRWETEAQTPHDTCSDSESQC